MRGHVVATDDAGALWNASPALPLPITTIEASDPAFSNTCIHRLRYLQAQLRAGDAFGSSGWRTTSRIGRSPVAVELREAARALAQLRNVEVGDRVFARFCIGNRPGCSSCSADSCLGKPSEDLGRSRGRPGE